MTKENHLKQLSLEIVDFLVNGNVSDNNKWHEESSIAYFVDFIQKQPQVLNYDGICPLIIIVSGLWSSALKRSIMIQKKSNYYTKLAHFYALCLDNLIKLGADPNIKHKHCHGSSVFHWLIAWDRSDECIKFIEMLKKHNVYWDKDIQDSAGNTPLTLLVARKYFGRHPICKKYDQALIEKLITEGCNPLIYNNEKNTSLHYAYLKHDIETINHIFNFTNTEGEHLKNNDNKTPIDLWNLSYQEAGRIIRKVYNASKIKDIMPEEIWQNANYADISKN
ncbi:putative ankyrin repeats containing protein [Candidatus Cyrtobacter comes]|uniref:Ankyrin repeats containing protein n=1 Tax=Candidatus Cyrtobacter comes TaxID=675776 RepID=A0ABU5L8C7_9RICK|nr:ankyrin repeat domain-containing protein [Candidatus Cyrtobacter comes]MDZ5762376.1 putative ankyrin repeats containing protein [Candidatus Cyrtobacter comes]